MHAQVFHQSLLLHDIYFGARNRVQLFLDKRSSCKSNYNYKSGCIKVITDKQFSILSHFFPNSTMRTVYCEQHDVSLTRQVKHLMEQLQRICNDLQDQNEVAIIKEYGSYAKFYTAALTGKKPNYFHVHISISIQT